jgi:PAS domain S-box-containing protein
MCLLNDDIYSDRITEKASRLFEQKEKLHTEFVSFLRLFSGDLKAELSEVRSTSRQQRFSNLLVFIGVVIISLSLISIIITRSVTRPLKRTLMLEKAVEQSGDGIVVMDFEGHIKFANMAWANMHGYRHREVTESKLKTFHDEDQFHKNVEPFFKIVEKQGFNTGEVENKRKDGTFFPSIITSTILNDENAEPIGTVSIVRDVTERKRFEKELKDAKVAAEAANEAKSNFLANMSHEIRTPMNGVIGMSELLLDTEMTSEQREFAERISKSADSLLTVINDILDYSKIEAGKVDLEAINFNLRATIEDVIDVLAVKVIDKDIELACLIHHEVPVFLYGDPGRLRQILMNLAGNAIKFTEKGEIVLHAVLDEEDDTHATIRFYVFDTGIGIPPEKTDRLFKSFSQLDSSTTRKYGGTGLGLVISKKLCGLMGGHIGVESELGKGTTFWFTAVFEKQPKDRSIEIHVSKDIKDKRILIVDDNETNRLVLKGQLSHWGCSFDEAPNGINALSLLRKAALEKNPFDIVILDMEMPELDGETVGKRIKEDPNVSDTAMVMLTSLGQRGDAIRMKEIGFSAYLNKPVKQAQLYDCLLRVAADIKSNAKAKGSPPLVTRHSITDDKAIVGEQAIINDTDRKVRILLAEDNEMNQKVAVNMLRKMGHDVSIANNGLEAVEAFEKKRYDLILMDCQMPEMDGIEATKEIRKREEGRDKRILIVALTAHAMKGDRERFLSSGMDDYLTKPVKKTILGTMIATHKKRIEEYRLSS